MDSQDRSLRDAMRVVGPALMAVGALCVFVLLSRMSSFNDSLGPFGGPARLPNPIWGFVGVALLGVGSFVTRWAWVGPAATYVARETAPALGIAARAAVDGARRPEGAACPSCRTQNASDAAFCKGCGKGLVRACAYCGGANAVDARFCADCGKPMRA